MKKSFGDIILELTKQHGEITLEKKIMANGGIQVTAYTVAGKYIKHIDQNLIPKDIFDTIKVTQDYRVNNPPCARCGKLGTELHHFAPQHLFDDAHLWPTAYLCIDCHRRWHKTILNHKRSGYE